MENVLREFREWLEKKNTKSANRVLKAINRDIMSLYLTDNGILICEAGLYSIPDYVTDEVERFAREKGYSMWWYI